MRSLNDDCLLTLFDRFSLQELLHLRIVCQQWKLLIEQHRFRRLKSIKLFGSLRDVQLYATDIFQYSLDDQKRFRLKQIGEGEDDDLILTGWTKSSITFESGQFLVNLFPNITFLVIYSKEYDLLKKMDFSYLLIAWGSQLNTLLFRNYTIDPLELNVQLWASCIPHLTALESLYIFSTFSDPWQTSQSLMPLIPQLKCFQHDVAYINSENILCKLNPDTFDELRIRVCSVGILLSVLERVLENTPTFVPNITRLSFCIFPNGPENEESQTVLKLVCSKFKLLKSLKLDFLRTTALEDVMPELAKLPHLEELYLDIRRFGWAASVIYTLPQLPSIKVLHITYFHPLFQLNRFAQAIAYLFPSLERLIIDAGEYEGSSFMFKKVCTEYIPNCKVHVVKYECSFRPNLQYIEGHRYLSL